MKCQVMICGEQGEGRTKMARDMAQFLTQRGFTEVNIADDEDMTWATIVADDFRPVVMHTPAPQTTLGQLKYYMSLVMGDMGTPVERQSSVNAFICGELDKIKAEIKGQDMSIKKLWNRR